MEPQEFDALRAELHDEAGPWPAAALDRLQQDHTVLVPWLLTELDRVLADPGAAASGFLVFHVLALCARCRVVEAHDRIARIARLPEAELDALLGDTITEGLDTWLAATWPGRPDALLAIVRDEEASEYVRSAAVHALGYVARWDLAPRDQVLTWLRELAGERVARLTARAEKLDFLLTIFAIEAGTLGAADWRPDVERWYRSRLADAGISRLSDFDQDLKDFAARDPTEPVPDFDLREELGWLYREVKAPASKGPLRDDLDAEDPFEPPDDMVAPLPGYSADAVGTVTRDVPKVGRNEPCPCGSGKKYKKCCAA